MGIKEKVKKTITNRVKKIVPNGYRYGWRLYKHTIKLHGYEIKGEKTWKYLWRNHKKIQVIPLSKKSDQIVKLISDVDICPIENDIFFYSIDCFKTIDASNRIYDNYSIDYNSIVNNSLDNIRKQYASNLDENSKSFVAGELDIIDALKGYIKRMKAEPVVSVKFKSNIVAIESLFCRSAASFFEALQRILFFNQFIWQTNHKNMGLGHLDWILQDLYQNDIESGIMSKEEAKEYLRQFFIVLHEYYWFKSSALMGDTGQIIILGGLETECNYKCSELTYLFIEISREMKLTEPKVFLRCSVNMPDSLLKCAIECIETGIGAPFLSNDDVVIPALIKAGYDEKDAYQYGASACWEPLIYGISCDQNNLQTFNFAKPFIDLLENCDLSIFDSEESFIATYEKLLASYIYNTLTPMMQMKFEEDPILSLVSETAVAMGKDITRGGVRYANIGLTSVGLGAVINSILNVEKFVFNEKRYSLDELNKIRKENFNSNEDLLEELKSVYPCFGSDDIAVVTMTKRIMSFTEKEFAKYNTKYGGKFKIGLSSPSYISMAQNTPATLDGRKNGSPFSIHISAAKALPTTEVLSFASKLDYSGLKCNGNVVDFIVNPEQLKANINKYCLLVKLAFTQGVFQMQMNVVSSEMLIAAKKHPEQFPDLIVRVWGFSAYFKDLPDEYKDVLIQRAVESEKAA